jgi:DNA-binding NarL/FixJ family response regulator
MYRIRTVTVSITPLLSDIVSQVVAEHAPIDIIASLDRSEGLARRLQMLAPDLVLIGLSQSEGDGIALSLRDALPSTKIIALSYDARHAYLPMPKRRCSALIDMSPNALIEAIRGF